MNFEETIPNDNLRRARDEQGWTQAELAEKLGTTFETVSRWERGKKAPGAYFRRKLCDVLGKTAQELGLLPDSGPPPTIGPSHCIFFSSAYADAERKFVADLKMDLQVRGVTVWSSRIIRRQVAGKKRNILQEAVHAAQVVLLVVSPATRASHHVHDTLRLAKHYKRPVCAVWIEGASLQECLPVDYSDPYTTIDAREGDDQLLRDKVVATLEQVWLTPASETTDLSEPIWKVPTILTQLIGREKEVARLRELLQRPHVRLITLSGPGGIGKTQLGLQVATVMREHFTDGVCFVSLATISDPRLIVPAIAKELEIREVGDLPLFEKMKIFLRKRHILLFLDNFEQVLNAAPQLSELLAECLHLRILVTSRARLRVHGEYGFPVPPLTLPDLTQPLESSTLPQYGAVALFLQRVRIAMPDFTITNANAHAIAKICVRLDGLPLAIELAAAHNRSLALHALLVRLEEHLLDIVISKDQDVNDRQRTLRNTIAWSYELLDSEEQQLFRRLAVFVGSWSLEAVEAVYTAQGEAAQHVWGAVEALLDKSLVQSVEQEGEGRLRLLETIREYGLERLKASGEAEIMQKAYAEYYMRLAEEAEPHLKGVQQSMWLARLEQELDNVRATLIWLTKHEEAELALRICGALWWFWRLRGYWSAGRRWLEVALSLPRTRQSLAARARALCAAGELAFCQDDYIVARSMLKECVELCRTVQAERELATALGILGVIMHMQGDLVVANSMLEESEELCRKQNLNWELSFLLRRLAGRAAQNGELLRAAEYAQESYTLAQKLGDTSLIATILCTLGEIAARQDDLTQAIAYNQESLTLSRELGDKLLMAYALNSLGYFAALQGDLTLAHYVQEGYTLVRELGDRIFIIKILNSVGYVNAHQGNFVQATTWYCESLSLAKQIQSETDIGMNLFGLALVAAAEGQLLQAARLLGAVEVRLDVNVDMYPAERAEYKHVVDSVRSQLGARAFTAARSEGRFLTVEQVLTAPRAPAIVNPPPSPMYPDGLTEREVQVLCLVAKGLTDEKIAEQLVIAPRTVNTHLTSIYRKIQASSVGKKRQVAPRIAAARYVTEHDLC